MLIHTYCPICDSAQFKNFLSVKDYTVSQQEFSIVKCLGCGFKFTNPVPTASEIGAYYQSDDYISHSDTNKGIINSLYKYIRNKAIKNKGDDIVKWHTQNKQDKNNNQSPRILDYGCGIGAFLNEMKLRQWQTEGVEPSENARKVAEKNYGIIPKAVDQMYHWPNESFNVVSLWHVLEHVHELKPTLEQIHRLLSSDGILIIAVPNAHAYDATQYGKFWAAYDVPRHLYHFTQGTMKLLLRQMGFEIFEMQLMPFDSYYVSMLSERYKNGYVNYLSAVWNGWRSNMKANSNLQYGSSITYVARKIMK